MGKVADLFREAGASRYAWGANDCLTLLAALVRLADPDGDLASAVQCRIDGYRDGHYPAAMQRARREHGSPAAAMLAELSAAGLPPANGDVQVGDLYCFEGVLLLTDGTVHDSERLGSLDMHIGVNRDGWMWTQHGLRRVADVADLEGSALHLKGGLRCMLGEGAKCL